MRLCFENGGTPPAVAGGIFRLTNPPAPVSVTRTGDELAFVAVVPGDRPPGAATLELFRGDTLRHRLSVDLGPPGRMSPVAVRLRYGPGPGSSRLTVALRLGGRVAIRCSVRLTGPSADLQGRFSAPPPAAPPSPATAVLLASELERLLTKRSTS